eukprot:97464_1
MFTKILAFAAVVTISNAVKQYVATFSAANSGASGTVTVDNGKIMVDVDLTDIDGALLPGGDLATCTTGGLKYHIHEKWIPTSNNDLIGETDCGGDNTGSHYDPWNACGGASGSIYCEGTTNPITTKCIPKGTGNYVPDYPSNYTSAEVGDWSSKYSLITLNSENKLVRTDMSFWEVTPDELDGFSIVFHCNAGARAFCAPFLPSNTDATATIPTQSSTGKTVSASFSALTDDSIIILYANGNVSVNIDATGTYESADINGCAEFEYSIFEPGSTTLDGNALGEACMDKVGAQYDPTNQCLPWSKSPFCMDDKICGANGSEYDCDLTVVRGRYTCAPGDLSAKFGILSNPESTVLENDSENKG